MISTHFSSTSYIANFIHKLHNNDHKSPIIRVVQRDLLTRIISISLSVFALLDCIVHTVGLLESGIKATILYAFGKVAEEEWKNLLRHGKSISIFIFQIPFWLLSGYTIPSTHLKVMENETVQCVNTMLLSERPEYSENSTVSSGAIVEYIEKQSKKMPQDECVGMERTLPLLSDAKKYLNQEQFYNTKNNFSVNAHLTKKLCNRIYSLRSHDQSKSIIAQFFCKEILTRLLSLGICLTSLIDSILQIMSIVGKIQFALIEKLILQSTVVTPKLNTFGEILLSDIRDLFIHIFGIITGPIFGMISPDLGKQIANPESTLFDPIRFAGENPTKAILSDVHSLPVGQSILLPLSFKSDNGSGHIVYCLIDNTSEGYQLSTLNTGYGSGCASIRLEALTYRINQVVKPEDWGTCNSSKDIANYTFRKLSKDQLTTHIQSIQQLAQMSIDSIEDEAKNQNLSEYLYIMSILYPRQIVAGEKLSYPEIGGINDEDKADFSLNPNLMFSKEQSIGDCPKSSLLAALNYHSSNSADNVNYQPYDKWVRHLKERIFDEDGYLIDMSLNLLNLDRGAYNAAREELDKSWTSYYSKYSE